MKSKLFYIILFLASNVMYAHNGYILNQLTEVNSQWLKQETSSISLNKVSLTQIKNPTDWIATHLMLVETTLRNRDISHLTKEQQQNRMRCLSILNNYWHLKKFPINDYLSYKTPVFIDRMGTHCAVGYLMQQTGNDALARMIDKEQKFAYVYDIKVKGVAEWAKTNGFTIDELAWIQPGYPVQSNADDLIGGLNGDVNAIITNANGVPLYAAGSFTASISGGQCNRIATYVSGFAGWLWTGLGNGVNGTVNSMIIHNNKLIVGGEFTMADNISCNHIAMYDLNLGTWQAMGSLDGNVNCLQVYNNEIYAGGVFTGYFSKWNGTQWIDISQNSFYGTGVRTLEVFNNLLYIGGDFELPTGALRKHVAAYDGNFILNSGFGTTTPVNDFNVYNGKLYAACDIIVGQDTCALAVLDNFDWQTVLKFSNSLGAFLNGSSIKQIKTFGSQLICAGSFTCMNGMSYGTNLMSYEHTNGTSYDDFDLMPMLNTDSTIKCLSVDNSNLYFGGSFITNSYTDTLRHIGTIDLLFNSLQKNISNNGSTHIYPNLVNEIINISNDAGLKFNAVVVYDMKGNIVFENNKIDGKLSFNLKQLSAGMYSLNLQSNGNVYAHRFVKQ